MNGTMDAASAGGLLPAEGQPKEMMAAGSLVAGVGLFIVSVIVVLAVGFVAGALVLIENIAGQILGKDQDADVEPARAVMPQQGIAEVEMA